MKKLIPTTLTVFRPSDDGREVKIEIVRLDLPEDPGYEKLDKILRPLLNGADLERVNVFHDGAYTDMFVDDVGKLKKLPRNDAATNIYRNNWMTHNPGTDPEDLPAIYGPAILFDRKVWF